MCYQIPKGFSAPIDITILGQIFVEIANYLNVSVDMLVGNRPIQFDPSLVGEFKELHDNPELRTLLKAASNLPKSSIKAMTVLAREMNNDL